MASIKWALSGRSGNPVTLLTTELNSLGVDAAALTAAIDNDADHDTFADFELFVNFSGTPGGPESVDLYAVRSVDGTNFEDASATGPIRPRAQLLGAFLAQANSTDQRLILSEVRLPPRDFKLMLYNRTTSAFGASANTLKMLTYTLAVV
jgi:hypothetical protein